MAGKETCAKRVLVVLGSPRRKGNSALLAERIAKGARACEATVKTVFLQDLNIAPCRGCLSCQTSGARGCVLRDDMQPIYRRLRESDAWVLASPVYWFTLSAQLKIFMDRCFALLGAGGQAFRGKKIAIAMSFGDKDAFSSGCVNALRTFQDAYGYVGAEIVGIVYGSAAEPGELSKNDGLMKEAEEIGAALVAE
ncbi:MAG: putative NAD(P)H-dependent FMN-containing oxidoreductase YwqN [Syntrophaceae bacterium PtaU1.Bin231]|nr:MAG: putative NAD(P)H-dependent FMN-containing oxidoreductase YwqN [Syntrophaceae bacterium PtaU1.Bin231]